MSIESKPHENKTKKLVKEEFGANSAYYVTSKVHATGASLKRLLEVVVPQANWQALDIATAAGHTALTFAPHVAHVTATDLTPEMILLAQKQAEEQGFSNVSVELADAEDLPYDSASFDLVTCRIAPHHFPNIAQFVTEAARALRPGGILAVVDNIVPEGEGGDFVNEFERLRDPSHSRCLSLEVWINLFQAAGLRLNHQEILVKEMVFETWASRHTPERQNTLRQMLTTAPPEAKTFLQPKFNPNETLFYLREGLLVGELV